MKPETKELYALIPLFKGATVWHYCDSDLRDISYCGMSAFPELHQFSRSWLALTQVEVDKFGVDSDDPDYAPLCSFCCQGFHNRTLATVGDLVRGWVTPSFARRTFEFLREARRARAEFRTQWPQIVQDIERAVRSAFPDRAELIIGELHRRAPVRE